MRNQQPKLSARYVLMYIEDLLLFVPQEDVDAVEIVADMRETGQGKGRDDVLDNVTLGWYGHGYGRPDAPIFGLNSELQLLDSRPNNSEFFTLLKHDTHPIGILAEEVETVHSSQTYLNLQALPVVMQADDSPLSGIILYDDKIACLAQGIDLYHYLQQQAMQYAQPQGEL